MLSGDKKEKVLPSGFCVKDLLNYSQTTFMKK